MAVDQYETNKQSREFQAEQQSRLRTLWGRQDQEWARMELERTQAKNLEMFEATAAQLHEELATRSKRVYDTERKKYGATHEEALERQGDWLKAWYGVGEKEGIAPEDRFRGEVMRRIIQANPDAGEHLMLAAGRDPAAGKLVDKMRSVRSVGIVPRSKTNGVVTLWAEYNLTAPNRWGQTTGPATKGRTDSPDDEVDLIPVTTPMLTKFFGSGYTTSQTPMMELLRRQMEAQDGGYGSGKGPATEEEMAAQAGLTPKPKQTTAPTVEAAAPAQTPEQPAPAAPAAAEQPAPAAPAAPAAAPVVERGPEPPAQADEYGIMPGDRTTVGSNEFYDGFVDRKTVGRIRSAGRVLKDDWNDLTAEGKTAGERGAALNRLANDVILTPAAVVAQPEVDRLTRLASAGSGKAGEFVKGYFGVADVPTSAKDVNKLDPEATVTLSAARNGDTGAAPAATQETAPISAKQVVAASRSKRRVPFRHELYNAMTLTKAGYMSEEDLKSFARTGKLPSKVETQLVNVGNGVLVEARTDEAGNTSYKAMNFGGGEGNSPATTQEQQALYNLLQDRTKGYFDEDPRGQADLIGSIEGTYDLLGIPGKNSRDLAIRSDSTNLNLIQNGVRLLKGFNEDDIQVIDLWPGDYVPQINAGNLAVATVLGVKYAPGTKQAAYAIRDYTQDLRELVSSDGELVERTKEIEAQIEKAKREKIPLRVGGQIIKINPGDSDHEIRTKVFEAMIKSR